MDIHHPDTDNCKHHSADSWKVGNSSLARPGVECALQVQNMASLLVEMEWIQFLVYDQDFWNTSAEVKSLLHSLLKMTAAFARAL